MHTALTSETFDWHIYQRWVGF